MTNVSVPTGASMGIDDVPPPGLLAICGVPLLTVIEMLCAEAEILWVLRSPDFAFFAGQWTTNCVFAVWPEPPPDGAGVIRPPPLHEARTNAASTAAVCARVFIATFLSS